MSNLKSHQFGSLHSLLLTALICGGLATNSTAAPGPCTVDVGLGNPIYVEMQTSLGAIVLELWPDVAPCTVNNFLAYMDSGRYDGTFIHRSVDSFVVQAGGYEFDSGLETFASVLRDPAVVNEPGASNLRATIAMARVGGQVDSATSEFFFNLSDTNVFLDTIDEGFTVFGVAAEASMVVVDDIAALPRVVGRWELNSPLRETFGELPVIALPSDPPGGFGCFDPFALPQTGLSGWLRALVNEALTALEPDPLTGTAYFLSATCDGSGAIGSPSVACTTDRTVAYSNGVGFVLDSTLMTCSRIAESEESLAARRDFHHPQVGSDLVEITTVQLPEPGLGIMLLWGVGGLCVLARSRA